jgi:chromosome segregation ATPase
MASTGTPRNQGVRRSADRILQEVPSAHQTFWGPLEEALKKTFADCTFHEKRLENARIARNRERDASGYGLDTPLRVLESINGGIAAAQRILNQTTAVLETVNPEHERNIPQVAQYAADLRAKVKTEETIIRSCEGQVVRLRKAIQVVEEEQRALDEAKRKHEEQMCWIDDAAQRLEEMKQSYAWKDDGKKDAAK